MKRIRISSRPVLKPPGMDPKLFPRETLFYWLALPRNPIFASEDPLTRMLIEAMLKNEPVEFIYVGGSKPGSPRLVNVSLVFQHEPQGRIYISGYCRERAAIRTFALDLIMLIHAWN
ncbi:MAG: WYL domain-containing protein [Limisphaerales bacterium]